MEIFYSFKRNIELKYWDTERMISEAYQDVCIQRWPANWMHNGGY